MEIKYGRSFKRQLKRLSRRYRHIRSDISPIISALGAGETPGEQITGQGHTLYKVRVRNSDSRRGKSGGYRVIYYLKTDACCIFVTIYSKSEQADIGASSLAYLISDVEQELGDESTAG